jgi:hypothetical protein
MGSAIYSERLFSKWSTLLLGVITAVMLWQVVQQFQTAPPDDLSPWFFPSMLVLFLAITVNFAWLTIRVTDAHVSVGYGVIRTQVLWHDIEDCYPDEASSVRYGGWGIRFGWYKGNRRLIYNVIGGPRVVLRRRNSRFPELVFSTSQPQEVIDSVRTHLRTSAR